jgi:Gpi18-like mannosyltransferase
LLICLLGMFVRLWLAFTPGLGYDDDVDLFRQWTHGLYQHGLRGFYDTSTFCDYPPVWLLIMWVLGHITAVFDPTLANNYALHALLKMPACFADLVIALVLYLEGRRLFGARKASGAAALYFLNPVSIYNSAYWGQVDAIHAALSLVSLVCVGRGRYGFAGAAAAIAILQKFQSIAFLPLILFELYRRGRFRALGASIIGAIAATALVVTPFAIKGVLPKVAQRAYVDVVGQYTEMSRSAYNLWWLAGEPQSSDLGVPASIVEVAAKGRVIVPEHDSCLLQLTWRRISMVIYSLCVAVILSVYAARPGAANRFCAAGLLGLAFFLFPTEMHERYSLPAIAFLPLWAVTSLWRERVFVLLSIMLLLNLVDYLPVRPISIPIAGVNLAIFGSLLLWIVFARESSSDNQEIDAVAIEPAMPRSLIVTAFQTSTAAGILIAIGLIVWLQVQRLNSDGYPEEPGVIYLDPSVAKSVEQSWGDLQSDKSVGGGLIHLGANYYLRGIGTHARSKLVYDVPAGAILFEALVGIDRITSGKGSIKIGIDVDGKEVFSTPALTGRSDPVPVRIPLHDAKSITLRADPTEDGQKADHVDWAMARFVANEKP